MLININVYVGPWAFKQLRYYTCGALFGRMNQFRMDVSMIRNINGI